MTRRALSFSLVLWIAACARPPETVVPRSHLASGEGPPVAIYVLVVNGVQVGDVEVLPGGTFHGTYAGRKADWLHVSLAVHDHSDRPVTVQTEEIQVLGLGAASLHPFAVNSQPRGSTFAVAPRGSGTFDAIFLLPPAVHSGAVARFQLDWAVHADGTVIRYGTSFVALAPAVPPSPGFPLGLYAPYVAGPVQPLTPVCMGLFCYGYP